MGCGGVKKSWTVALEEPHGRIEALHETPDHRVELPEHLHQLLGLDRVDEAGPSAEVGEEHRDHAPMAAEDRVVTRRDDRFDELRREEPAELPDPLELHDLGLHPLLERSIQLGELRGLRRDRVVVALDPQERPDPREQFVLVERLGDQIVRARPDRLGPLRRAGRDHDHRQHRGVLALPDPATHLVPVRLRHHDIEHHQVRLGRRDELERACAVGRGDDVVAARREHGFEQPHVRRNVVHDQDPGLAAHPGRPSQCSRTIPISSRTFTGFDT